MAGSGLQYRFDNNLEKLVGGGKLSFLAAVSGGPDSMCMLNLLQNSALRCSVAVAHMNFNLRPGDCDNDEALVREWAERHSLPLFVKRVDTHAYAAEHSISVEMAARELRYNWFSELIKEHGFDYVAVAHNANDNAETLLLNLVRGSGLRGLCGIRAIDRERKIVRPLMIFERDEIESYARRMKLPVAIDKTNFQVDFSRNRIRNIVIEELKKINPSLIATLNRDIANISKAYDFLEGKRCESMGRYYVASKDFYSVLEQSIGNTLARRLVYMALKESFKCAISISQLQREPGWEYPLFAILNEYGFSGDTLNSIIFSINAPEFKLFESPGFVAVKERGYIKVFSKEFLPTTDEIEVQLVDEDIEKRNGGAGTCKVVKFGNLNLSFTLIHGGDELSLSNIKRLAAEGVIVLDADKLSSTLSVRGAVAGDTFAPLGMRGNKRLADYYTDIKIDNLLKSKLPIVLSQGVIVAIPGLQVSQMCKVSGQTSRFIVISLKSGI